MKIKTSELIGKPLDWAVGLALGWDIKPNSHRFNDELVMMKEGVESVWFDTFNPSTDWAQGGTIIEREGIELLCNLTATEAARFSAPGVHADWQAFYRSDRRTAARQFAITPLIAAMRRFVASRMGDIIEIPKELK